MKCRGVRVVGKIVVVCVPIYHVCEGAFFRVDRLVCKFD